MGPCPDLARGNQQDLRGCLGSLTAAAKRNLHGGSSGQRTVRVKRHGTDYDRSRIRLSADHGPLIICRPSAYDRPRKPEKHAMNRTIIIHWTGGSHSFNASDARHYHFGIDGDGAVHEGNLKPEANLDCTDGNYVAPHAPLQHRIDRRRRLRHARRPLPSVRPRPIPDQPQADRRPRRTLRRSLRDLPHPGHARDRADPRRGAAHARYPPARQVGHHMAARPQGTDKRGHGRQHPARTHRREGRATAPCRPGRP